jgi:hypothetical protein
VKTTLEVEIVYFMVGFENCLGESVGEMVHRSAADPSTVSQKEGYPIDKKIDWQPE